MMTMVKEALKRLSFIASPMTVGIIITGFMTWVAVQFYSNQRLSKTVEGSSLLGVFEEIHRKTIDYRFLMRGESPGSPRVAILAIDDASIEREGRWPWPREKIGRLIENAVDAGAKVVAFDVVFSEADQTSSSRVLSNLKMNLAKTGSGNILTPELGAILDKEIDSGDSDKRFADSVGLYQDSVVMGTYYDTETHTAGVALNPLRDYCIDAQYGRTYEKKYWENDLKSPVVIDPSYNAENTNRIPPEAIDRLSTHITNIEILAVIDWFKANSAATSAITEALFNLDINLPTEMYPILFNWANIGDTGNLMALLQENEATKKYAHPTMVNKIFADVLRAIPPQDLANLRQIVRSTSYEYCERFLTSEDELLDRKKLEKNGVEGFSQEDLDTNWEGLGIEPLWNRLVAEKKVQPIPLATAIENWRENAAVNPIEIFEKTWISVPEVAKATRHTGFFNANLDPDGTIRRARLVARRGHLYIPSLALKSFLVDRGLQARFTLDREITSGKQRRQIIKKLEFVRDRKKKADGTDEPEVVAMTAPVDSEGRLAINYAGPQQMFPYISASSLLAPGNKLEISQRITDPETGIRGPHTQILDDRKAFLKDKLLIVGATSIGVYDLRQTPFEENYPGVETHANVLSNLLTEEARASAKLDPSIKAPPATQPGFLKLHPFEQKWAWVLLLIVGLGLSAGLTYLGSIAGLLSTASVLFTLYAIDRYVIFTNGYVINISLPIITTFSLFVGITSYKYFTEERNKRALKGTFAKYVSPAVVEEILKDPSNIELGGKKMEMTVMFSDVRGFTTISEKLDPRALSDLLNSYLTPMTDLVFATKGTLDKYMGDAIMAFWGAPIQFSDHAEKAANCALLMLKKLKELQAEYAAKGLPTIDIGIGLNTGEMSVGNMGSNTVRSYTVMGDSVNLGSRLEGINKEYGTRIIVSEFTQAKIAKNFVTREVDWVRVKGKAQPVRIFELIGTVAPGDLAAPADMLALIPDFETGFRLYHERKFDEAIAAFTKALNTKPTDECSQLYIERCQDYQKDVPPADWDGVYTMKTK